MNKLLKNGRFTTQNKIFHNKCFIRFSIFATDRNISPLYMSL